MCGRASLFWWCSSRFLAQTRGRLYVKRPKREREHVTVRMWNALERARKKVEGAGTRSNVDYPRSYISHGPLSGPPQRFLLRSLVRSSPHTSFLISLSTSPAQNDQGHRYRFGYHLLVSLFFASDVPYPHLVLTSQKFQVCRCLAKRSCRDHCERPGQPHDSILCRVHRHRASDRRCRQEPGRDEPS